MASANSDDAKSPFIMRPSPRHQIAKGQLALMIIASLVGLALVLKTWSLGRFTVPYLTSPVHAASIHSPLDYDTAAPFVFDSVKGLLSQWPNSYAPNGHSIVLGTLSPATVLYHASKSGGAPKLPTFFAFDAEMSVGIYGGFGQADLHVYGTKRALNVLYFDGQSATLNPHGTLDSQLAMLQGKVPLYPPYDLVYDDDQRALDLCRFSSTLGIDGVVRMNAGFEILLCDYSTNDMEELFVTNITVPGNLENDKNESLPHDPNRQPPRGFGNVFSEQGSWEWLRSATWHYGQYGESGPPLSNVNLDLCRIVSFYDPALTSLAGSHHGGIAGNQTFENGWGLRRGHRLLDIDEADVETARSWLKEMTSSLKKPTQCSGIDWPSLFKVIQAQHGTRAREITAALEWKHDTVDDAKQIATKVHELTHAILIPYLEYRTEPDTAAASKAITLSRCSSVYTALVDEKQLARSEVLIYESIKIIMAKLCRWEWDLFEWSERRTTNYLEGHEENTTLVDLQREITTYNEEAVNMLKWMGWHAWSRCERQCGVDELCTIPTWPVVYAPGLPQGGIYAASNPKLTTEETYEFWRPKCINRTDFDHGGGRGREPKFQFPDVPSY